MNSSLPFYCAKEPEMCSEMLQISLTLSIDLNEENMVMTLKVVNPPIRTFDYMMLAGPR